MFIWFLFLLILNQSCFMFHVESYGLSPMLKTEDFELCSKYLTTNCLVNALFPTSNPDNTNRVHAAILADLNIFANRIKWRQRTIH